MIGTFSSSYPCLRLNVSAKKYSSFLKILSMHMYGVNFEDWFAGIDSWVNLFCRKKRPVNHVTFNGITYVFLGTKSIDDPISFVETINNMNSLSENVSGITCYYDYNFLSFAIPENNIHLSIAIETFLNSSISLQYFEENRSLSLISMKDSATCNMMKR